MFILIGVAVSIGAGLMLYLYFPGAARTSGSGEPPKVLTGSSIYGYPLEHWAHAFWQWNIAFRPDDLETDPQTNLNKCIVGSDPNQVMIFLIDPYDLTYNGKCTIASEKPILVPLLTSEWENSGDYKSYTVQEMWAGAKEANEVFRSWDVNLDGASIFKKVGTDEVNPELKDQILVRNSSMITLEIPEHNKFDTPPGTYNSVVDGYYLILEPLSTGEHVLKYKITHEIRVPGADLSYIYGDVTYTLDVK